MVTDRHDRLVIERGTLRLSAAVERGRLDCDERAALAAVLDVLAVVDRLDLDRTVSLPVLAGRLAAVVDGYRAAARRVGGGR